MKLLEDRIKKEGQALSETVLKVDSFINHQVDSEFMDALGADFAEHFKDAGITRFLPLKARDRAGSYDSEASGCADGHPEKADIQDLKWQCLSDPDHFLYKGDQL